ncbi:MAG: sigma-70 family RNA polymerase sigma factor [Planctomycetes bacterium]|nr:sigma-70 family RNA polymerase sigma factor [Planctomycetota bacterium]
MTQNAEQFVTQLTAAQTAIYAYILTLLPDRGAAEDVLQETNLTLWRKADQFEAGTNFTAWACQIAHYKVLGHRRSSMRDRHVFCEATLERLAARLDAGVAQLNDRRDALRRCLDKLSDDQRDLLRKRYEPDGSVQRLADEIARPVGSVSQTLYRLRQALLECIRRRLAEERAS